MAGRSIVSAIPPLLPRLLLMVLLRGPRMLLRRLELRRLRAKHPKP